MKIFLSFIVLFVYSQLNFPYTCDCQEHNNQSSCEAHSCKWDTSIKTDRKCRVQSCDERSSGIAECVYPSQFYSTNRTSCYPLIPSGKTTEVCSQIYKCEDLDVSKISQSYARRLCKVNFCGYDPKTKICKTIEYCEELSTEDECNSFFINELPTLFQPKAYCYWAGDICMQATRFFGECENRNIKNKLLCKAHGCQWKDEICQNLNCTTITTNLCKLEHIDSFGQVHVCDLKNDVCNVTKSANIRMEDCNKMVGHTFDDQQELCKPCVGLSRYLVNATSENVDNQLLVYILLMILILV